MSSNQSQPSTTSNSTMLVPSQVSSGSGRGQGRGRGRGGRTRHRTKTNNTGTSSSRNSDNDHTSTTTVPPPATTTSTMNDSNNNTNDHPKNRYNNNHDSSSYYSNSNSYRESDGRGRGHGRGRVRGGRGRGGRGGGRSGGGRGRNSHHTRDNDGSTSTAANATSISTESSTTTIVNQQQQQHSEVKEQQSSPSQGAVAQGTKNEIQSQQDPDTVTTSSSTKTTKKKPPKTKKKKSTKYGWRKHVPHDAMDPISLDLLKTLEYPPFALSAEEPYNVISMWPIPSSQRTTTTATATTDKSSETQEEQQEHPQESTSSPSPKSNKQSSSKQEQAKAQAQQPYVHLYDGRVLAYYLVSQLQFMDPLNRRQLRREELVNLDRYLYRNQLGKARVVEAYDEQQKQLRHAEAFGGSNNNSNQNSNRADVLQREARAILESLFAGTYGGPSGPSSRNNGSSTRNNGDDIDRHEQRQRERRDRENGPSQFRRQFEQEYLSNNHRSTATTDGPSNHSTTIRSTRNTNNNATPTLTRQEQRHQRAAVERQRQLHHQRYGAAAAAVQQANHDSSNGILTAAAFPSLSQVTRGGHDTNATQSLASVEHDNNDGGSGGLIMIDDDLHPGMRGHTTASSTAQMSASGFVNPLLPRYSRPQPREAFPSLGSTTTSSGISNTNDHSSNNNNTTVPQSTTTTTRKKTPSRSLKGITSLVEKTDLKQKEKQRKATEEFQRRAEAKMMLQQQQLPPGTISATSAADSQPSEGMLERNQRLAGALGVVPSTCRINGFACTTNNASTIGSGWARPTTVDKPKMDEFGNELRLRIDYPMSLMLEAKDHLDFLEKLERRLKVFLSDDKNGSLSLRPMNPLERKIVHEYCVFWSLRTESFDPPPKRYVHCSKLPETSMPYPLLSTAIKTHKGPWVLPGASSSGTAAGAVPVSGTMMSHPNSAISGGGGGGFSDEESYEQRRSRLLQRPTVCLSQQMLNRPPGLSLNVTAAPRVPTQTNSRAVAAFERERPKLNLVPPSQSQQRNNNATTSEIPAVSASLGGAGAVPIGGVGGLYQQQGDDEWLKQLQQAKQMALKEERKQRQTLQHKQAVLAAAFDSDSDADAESDWGDVGEAEFSDDD